MTKKRKRTRAIDKVPNGPDDSPEVCWRRGLLHRAQSATAGAAFEDWSHFTVDSELAQAAARASESWKKTAAYLKELNEKKR